MKRTVRRHLSWRVVLPILAICAVVPAVAFGAGTSFSGKGTDDKNVSVKFERHGGPNPYVTQFKTNHMYYGKPCKFRSGVDLGKLHLAIQPDGTFHFKGSKTESNGITYTATVDGKFKSARKAVGTTKETRSNGSQSCSAKDDWSAHK